MDPIDDLDDAFDDNLPDSNANQGSQGEAKSEQKAQQKQAQLLNQGRRVNVEGREITVVSKEALLKFIEDNLPSGQNLSGSDVLSFYNKIERLEAERKEAILRQQEAQRQAEELTRKLAEAEGRIVALNQNIEHLQERDAAHLESLKAFEQRVHDLDEYGQQLAGTIAEAAEANDRQSREIEAQNDRIKALEEKLALISGSDAEKLARIESLEAREQELLELVTRYRRDLTFAAGIREPESAALLTQLRVLKDHAESVAQGQLAVEVDRLQRIISRHQSQYPGLLQRMNHKEATIDVVVELCLMAREEILVRRQLRFLATLTGQSVTGHSVEAA